MNTDSFNEGNSEEYLKKPENFVPNVTKEESEEIKKILSSFYNSIDGVVENIVKESFKNEELGKIMEISLNNSVTVNKKYKIKIRKEKNLGTEKNFYDIYDEQTGQQLCKDIFLFEIAESIVELLNKGEPIYGPKIRKIFYLEQSYVKHRQDAAIYKKRMEQFNKSKNRKKFEIYKLKYEEAKNKALKARDKIRELKYGEDF